MSRLITVITVVICSISASSATSPDSCPLWIGGHASAVVDDAQSIATCPAGTYVASCFCKDEKTCDGAQVKSPRKCVAFQSAGQYHPTKAVALCVPKDDDETVVVENHWVGAGEVIQCQAGFTRKLCVKNDPWTPPRAHKGITRVIQLVDGCKWEGPAYVKPKFWLSLLCVKKDGCMGDGVNQYASRK